VLFLGVDTSGSAALDAFPCWSSILGLDAAVEGVDLPLNSGGDAYRLFVDNMRRTASVRGAVVTAHKANLFHAARGLVDEVREHAVRCREISVLGRAGARVFADAIDVASIRATMAEMLPRGCHRTWTSSLWAPAGRRPRSWSPCWNPTAVIVSGHGE
jgi:shikimate dehydrogenase